MIRKFNLTNGVSVVITEELAVKYELDTVHSDAAFVSVLAAIVSAQEIRPTGDSKRALTTLLIDDDTRAKLEAEKFHPYQQEFIDKIRAGDGVNVDMSDPQKPTGGKGWCER